MGEFMKRRDLITLGLASLTFSAMSRRTDAHTPRPAKNPVVINYHLGKYGWSSFRLKVGTQTTDIGTFSYTTNALDDLIDLATKLVTSTEQAQISFDGEPFEWRMIVDQGAPPERRLRVLTFNDILHHQPDAAGNLDFEAQINPHDFARAVQKAAHRIWSRYGEKGYRKAWIGDRGFPTTALQALDAALLSA